MLGVICEMLENMFFESIEDILFFDLMGGVKVFYLFGKMSGIFYVESDGIKLYFKYFNGDGIYVVVDILVLYCLGLLGVEMMKIYIVDEFV